MVKMTNHRPPSLSSANCQKSGRYPWKQACKTLGYLIFLLYCGSGCLWIKMSMFCAIRSKKDKKHKLTGDFKIVSGMLRICNINADESRWVLQAQNCSGKAKGLVLIISVHVSTLENTLIYQLKCGTAVQRKQTQQLFCHFELDINACNGHGSLRNIGFVYAWSRTSD